MLRQLSEQLYARQVRFVLDATFFRQFMLLTGHTGTGDGLSSVDKW